MAGVVRLPISVLSIVKFRVILTFQCTTHDWKSGYWHWNVQSTFNRHNMFDMTLNISKLTIK